VYRRDDTTQTHRAWGIWVLTLDAEAIAEITAFVDPAVVHSFGLPSELPRDPRDQGAPPAGASHPTRG
jgi:hypothetical protein